MPWLSGWAKRVKLTIDHNDIGAALSDFPLTIFINGAAGRNSEDITFIFDEVGSNRFKIALTTSDGETQCYVEVEKWDSGAEEAALHAKIPSIASGADTDLYLYFDNSHADNTTYVGNVNSTPGENVWDSAFEAVWHCGEASGNLVDSTQNDHDLTETGSPTRNADGTIDGGIQTDGADNDDFFTTTSFPDFAVGDTVVIEAWTKPTSLLADNAALINFRQGGGTSGHWFVWANAIENVWARVRDDGNHVLNLTSTSTFLANDEIYIAFRVVSGGNAYLYWNGSQEASGADPRTGVSTNNYVSVHVDIYPVPSTYRYEAPAITSEIRISIGDRDADWIAASYESGRDDLLDWGTEEQASQSQTRSVDNTVSSQWNNPNNAFSENDSCTDTDGDGNQNVYNMTGTPFSIPTGATIVGILVNVIRGGDADDYYTIELYDSTSTWRSKTGSAYSGNCAGGAQETLGGAADTWSGTWTAAHINSSSFQVRLTYAKAGKANVMYVDHIEVVVYYTAAGPQELYQTVTDLAGLVDSIAKTWTGHKTVSDQTGLLDSVIAAQGIKVVVGDLAGLLDTIELSLGYQLSTADIVGLLDTVATLKAQFQSITDLAGLTDSISTAHLGHLSTLDLAGLLDSIALQQHLQLTVADISGLLDAVSLLKALFHAVTDQTGLLDSVGVVWSMGQTVTDIVGLLDSVAKHLYGKTAVTDQAGLLDAITVVFTAHLTATDLAGLLDTILTVLAFHVAISDPLGLTDSVAHVWTGHLATLDILGLVDSVSYVHTPGAPPSVPPTETWYRVRPERPPLDRRLLSLLQRYLEIKLAGD